MTYRMVFTALSIGLTMVLATILLDHGGIPRWRGWMAMGTMLLLVAMLGLAHSCRTLERR